ncbi:MAG: hypothetical protein ACFB9N_11630 [Geitlerinemataceae cyanobacterium]
MKRKAIWAIVLATVTALVVALAGDRVALQAASSNPIAQAETAEPAPETSSTATDLSLSGNTYTADGQFSMAILAQANPETGVSDEFTVTPTAGVPLIESPDRSLAYTAIVRQRALDRVLSPNALAQVTIEALQRGEGFVADAPIEVAAGEIVLPWTGMAKGKPLAGKAIVIQEGSQILTLVVSATGDGIAKVNAAAELLAPSFGLPSPPVETEPDTTPAP